jgi:hypothetical protein
MATLAAMATHFRHRNALDAEGTERLADLLELEWLDHCNYKFHAHPRFLD